MWRQMIRILPKQISSVCCNRNASRRSIFIKTKHLAHSAFLLSATNIVIDDHDADETCMDDPDLHVTEIDDLQLSADLKIISAESGEALNSLIKTLHACIQEICDQYQFCLARQIEITLACMELEPVGPHWDQLTKYRVLAEDLKVELIKYRTLIATIGSIVQNDQDQHLVKDMVVAKAYRDLVELIDKKMKENNSWESKLLDVHTQSIFYQGS